MKPVSAEQPILDFAEMQAEIARLRAEVEDGSKLSLTLMKYGADQKARCLDLEAENAILRGTVTRPDADDDQPAELIDTPPNAPR